MLKLPVKKNEEVDLRRDGLDGHHLVMLGETLHTVWFSGDALQSQGVPALKQSCV